MNRVVTCLLVIIAIPCSAQSIEDRLFKSISDLPGDDATLESSSKVEIATGEYLPDEFIGLKSNDDPFGGSIYNNDNHRQQVVFEMSNAIKAGNAGLIPETLVKYSDQLPPTESDIRLVLAAESAIGIMIELGDYDQDRYPSTTIIDWKPLADSKSALYRYLALRGISSSLPKGFQDIDGVDSIYVAAQERFDALEVFSNEKDPFILDALASTLSRIPVSDSKIKLVALRDRFLLEGNDYKAKQIDSLILGLQGLLDNKPKHLYPGNSQAKELPYQDNSNTEENSNVVSGAASNDVNLLPDENSIESADASSLIDSTTDFKEPMAPKVWVIIIISAVALIAVLIFTLRRYKKP